MARDDVAVTVRRSAIGCGALALIATVWCLIGATVVVIAWNVAIAPLAGMPRMTFVQAVALVLLVELIAHLFERCGQQGNDSA